MKQKIISNFSAIILLFLFGCCASENTEQKDKPIQPPKTPTTIQENRSTVLAEVLSYYENKENHFVLKLKVVELFEDGAYPSLAQLNFDYFCSPNFALDENGMRLENDKNKNLDQLKMISSGKKFKTEIFFQPKTGWFINNVISIQE